MKKSGLFASIILLAMAFAFTACAGSDSSSSDTGYNTITFTRNLMVPYDLKKFDIGGLTEPASPACLAVSYSGTWDDTNYTAFAISTTDGNDRLTLVIKDLLLDDGEVTGLTHSLDSTNVITKYIEINPLGSNSITTTVSGTATANISKTLGSDPVVTDINGDNHTYYVTTITFTDLNSFTIGGLTITPTDTIVAMHYPQAEPDMTE